MTIDPATFPTAWFYRFSVRKTVDGDTIEAYIDWGFNEFGIHRVRLLGVNAPEKTGITKEAGLAATAFTAQWFVDHMHLPLEWPFRMRTYKTDVFARYLADVYCAHGHDLGEDLLASGNAVLDVRTARWRGLRGK